MEEEACLQTPTKTGLCNRGFGLIPFLILVFLSLQKVEAWMNNTCSHLLLGYDYVFKTYWFGNAPIAWLVAGREPVGG